MKHIKNWKLFESVWNLEEFVEELAYHLGKYNLTAVYIREVINKYDIETAIESGMTPLQLSKEIISELDIESRGTEGYPGVPLFTPRPDRMKYL